MKKALIFSGGTCNPISSHLAICAPAFGATGFALKSLIYNNLHSSIQPVLLRSKIAGGKDFHTNQELKNLVDRMKGQPDTKIMFFPVAIADFECVDGSFDKKRPKEWDEKIILSQKIIDSIRDRAHKHIFLVTFKNTYDCSPQEMFEAGLSQLKRSSSNLVFVNDAKSRRNMIVTPEEATYADGMPRELALKELVNMSILRSQLSFTQSTVIDAETVPWKSRLVPNSLRKIVDYCRQNNAYKVFHGGTVGHFAVKLSDTEFLTSIRKSDFNKLDEVGLVKVVSDSPDTVLAYGAKPSVGGQSQRVIFKDHFPMDCIAHFHCPLKKERVDDIPIVSQREYECGSVECGINASNGLRQFGNLKAVYLDNHGPNIVFPKTIDPKEVIDFIERNFDLSKKTGGYNL